MTLTYGDQLFFFTEKQNRKWNTKNIKHFCLATPLNTNLPHFQNKEILFHNLVSLLMVKAGLMKLRSLQKKLFLLEPNIR